MNQHLATAQFFYRENQASDRAAVADADASDGVQIAHQTALVDGRQGGRTMCRRSGYAFHSGTAYQFTAWLRIDFSLLRQARRCYRAQADYRCQADQRHVRSASYIELPTS